jgi:hypothetical protein
MMKVKRRDGHTRWMRPHEIKRAALILGVIDKDDKAGAWKIEKILKEREAAHKILKKKAGTARNAPAAYCAVRP